MKPRLMGLQLMVASFFPLSGGAVGGDQAPARSDGARQVAGQVAAAGADLGDPLPGLQVERREELLGAAVGVIGRCAGRPRQGSRVALAAAKDQAKEQSRAQPRAQLSTAGRRFENTATPGRACAGRCTSMSGLGAASLRAGLGGPAQTLPGFAPSALFAVAGPSVRSPGPASPWASTFKVLCLGSSGQLVRWLRLVPGLCHRALGSMAEACHALPAIGRQKVGPVSER